MADNIEIRGLEKLLTKFGKFENLKPELRKTTDKATKFVWSLIPPYPAKPATSDYRRTGTLGRTMYSEVKELGSQVAGVIGNNTVYAPWVISATKLGDGRGPQSRYHYRWYTLHQVIKDAKNGVIQIYHNWIKGLID